jgi:hypothetical protein
MKSRIADCQKSCDDLRQKFNTRVNMDTNVQGAKTQGIITEIKGAMDDNSTSRIYTIFLVEKPRWP